MLTLRLQVWRKGKTSGANAPPDPDLLEPRGLSESPVLSVNVDPCRARPESIDGIADYDCGLKLRTVHHHAAAALFTSADHFAFLVDGNLTADWTNYFAM